MSLLVLVISTELWSEKALDFALIHDTTKQNEVLHSRSREGSEKRHAIAFKALRFINSLDLVNLKLYFLSLPSL